MSESDGWNLHDRGSAAAKEAADLCGGAIEFIKKGQAFYVRFINERTIGFQREWMWCWLGGFNAKMLNLVVAEYAKLEAAVTGRGVSEREHERET